MNTLHPFTVRTQEAVPTIAEQLTDSTVRVRGNSYESSIAIQEEAEATYAEMMVADAAAELEDERAAAMDADLWTAEAALTTVAKRYGNDAAVGCVVRVSAELVKCQKQHGSTNPAPLALQQINPDPAQAAFVAIVTLAQQQGFTAAREAVQKALEEIVRRDIRPELPKLKPITQRCVRPKMCEGMGWSA